MLHESFDEHKLKEDLRPSREELEWELDAFLHNIVLRFGFEADEHDAHDAAEAAAADDESVVFDAATAATATATATGGDNKSVAATASPRAPSKAATATGRAPKWSDLYRFSQTRAAFAHDIGLVLDKYSSLRRSDRKLSSAAPPPPDPRSIGTAAGVSGATAS